MTQITQIKPQRNKKRVNIYLDDKFSFGLDLENFVKLGLKVGQELSESDVINIVKKAEYAKVSDKLLRFATLRPRSKQEYDMWLKKHKVHQSMHKKLFNKLKRLDLLNDEQFAKWWVGQRVQFKSKSKREIIYELRIKGIGKEMIQKVLSEIEVNEEKMVKDLVAKNMYKWRKLDKAKARQKMTAYLARKGFSWDIVKKAVDSVLKIE